jgi:hypothetical protein
MPLLTALQSVKSLSEKLQKVRSEAAPAKKFQFRSARKAAQQASPGASQQTEQPQRPMERRSNATSTMSTPPGSATIPGAPAASGKQTLGISNQVSAHVKLNPADCSAPGSGTITNINRSVIDISGPTETNGPYASLVLKDIQNSLIVTGHVDGPVHMTGLKNTVLVTACRQFRMHASSKVDVYLHCSSRPIIEDCERIRFAPIPETFVSALCLVPEGIQIRAFAANDARLLRRYGALRISGIRLMTLSGSSWNRVPISLYLVNPKGSRMIFGTVLLLKSPRSL